MLTLFADPLCCLLTGRGWVPLCLVGRAAEKVELEWKLQEQEQAAVKSEAAAVAAAVGAAEDR